MGIKNTGQKTMISKDLREASQPEPKETLAKTGRLRKSSGRTIKWEDLSCRRNSTKQLLDRRERFSEQEAPALCKDKTKFISSLTKWSVRRPKRLSAEAEKSWGRCWSRRISPEKHQMRPEEEEEDEVFVEMFQNTTTR